MKLVCISDTHEKQAQVNLPEGDVLVHTGDLTNQGSIPALTKVAAWFKKQDFKHKVMICGNHDFGFQNANHDAAVKLFTDAGVTYLQDSETIIEGIKFYGAPWQPWFMDWAFNLPRGAKIAEKWAKIPDDTNVLMTHGPPHGILDLVEDTISNRGRDLHQGCEELTKRLMDLTQLKAHVFGHLHLSGGMTQMIAGVTFANAAICTERYQASNKPIVIEV